MRGMLEALIAVENTLLKKKDEDPVRFQQDLEEETQNPLKSH